MICNQCGKSIPDDSLYCPICGARSEHSSFSANSENQTVTTSASSLHEKDIITDSVNAPSGAIRKRDKRKQLPLILAGGSVILIVLLAVLGSVGSHSGESDYLPVFAVATQSPDIAVNQQETVADPDASYERVPFYNGMIIKTPAYKCVCPLSVSVRGDKNYYVYLKYISAPGGILFVEREAAPGNGSGSDISFLISAGSSAELLVPIGRYKLYYAVGDDWFGEDDKFGSNTRYSCSDDLLDFYADSEYYQGHSLELWLQANGNFDSYEIDKDSFPG